MRSIPSRPPCISLTHSDVLPGSRTTYAYIHPAPPALAPPSGTCTPSSPRPPAAGRPSPTPADSSSPRYASMASLYSYTEDGSRGPPGSRQLPQAKPARRGTRMDPAPTQIRPLELTRPARTPRVADTVTHTPHSACRTPHADSTADPFHHDRSRASGAGARGESERAHRSVSCVLRCH